MRGKGTRFRGTLLSAALACAFAPLAAWAQSSMPRPGLSVIKTPAEDARPIDPSHALPRPPVFHLVAAPAAAPEPAYEGQDASDEGYEPGYAGGYGGYGDYGYYDPGYRNGRGDHDGHDGHDGHNDHHPRPPHPRPPREPGNSVTVAVPPPGTRPRPIGPVEVKVAPPPRQPPPGNHAGKGTPPAAGTPPGNGIPHR